MMPYLAVYVHEETRGVLREGKKERSEERWRERPRQSASPCENSRWGREREGEKDKTRGSLPVGHETRERRDKRGLRMRVYIHSGHMEEKRTETRERG